MVSLPYFQDSRCSSDRLLSGADGFPIVESFSARPRTFAISFDRGAADMSGRP
jgi:hypothetical protein